MTLTGIHGLLLDMDGVLGVSWRPLPGAAAAVARLRAAGLPMRVLTSTTGRCRADIAAALRSAGFDFADEELLTAAVLAGDHVREHHRGARVFLLGDAQREDLPGIEFVGIDDEPDLILVSGSDESFAFEPLNRVYRRLLRGATLVGMHRNLSWMTAAGENLDAGAYLAGLELATGVRAVVTGKPAPECFRAGLDSLGLPAGRVAMVGDDVVNDVLAAQALGITGVLVRTGKFSADKLAAAAGAPDHVIGSIADLPRLLGI